jgi:hypothetical protein
MRLTLSLFLAFIMLSTVNAQQEKTLILEGRVEEGTVRAIVKKNARDQYIPIQYGRVQVLSEGLLVESVKTDSLGLYKLELLPNKRYHITFQKEGYLDKVFEIDGRKYNHKKNRAHLMESDVALFRDLGDQELRNYVQMPSAKCRYYRNRKEFKWDMMYAESQQKHFLKLLEQATVASLNEDPE